MVISLDDFPDHAKLKNKLEWLTAIRSGDVDQITRAQTNIIRRRTDTAYRTGGSHIPRGDTNASTSNPSYLNHLVSDGVTTAPNLRLDDFVRTTTSEDAASFHALIEDAERRKRARYAHLWKPRGLLLLPPNSSSKGHGVGRPITGRLLAPPTTTPTTGGSVTDVVVAAKQDNTSPAKHPPVRGSSVTHSHLISCFNPRNPVFYDTSQQEPRALTVAEKGARVRGPPKEIRRENTRLAAPTAPGRSEASTPGISTPYITDASGHTDVDADGDEWGKERGREGDRDGVVKVLHPTYNPHRNQPALEPSRGGAGPYAWLATPDLRPGAAGAPPPVMTFGEMAGTPLRLDLDPEDDVDVGPGVLGVGGKGYTMPKRHVHDRVLDGLLEGKKKGGGGSRAPPKPGQGRVVGRARAGTGGLSDAAQRLASRMRIQTPRLATPQVGMSRGSGGSGGRGGGRGAGQTRREGPGMQSRITDGLLDR